MENIIREMIQKAYEELDLDLLNIANDLMYELETTINVPSDWEDIAKTMAAEFADNKWVLENADTLWDYY